MIFVLDYAAAYLIVSVLMPIICVEVAAEMLFDGKIAADVAQARLVHTPEDYAAHAAPFRPVDKFCMKCGAKR